MSEIKCVFNPNLRRFVSAVRPGRTASPLSIPTLRSLRIVFPNQMTGVWIIYKQPLEFFLCDFRLILNKVNT